MVDEAAPLVGKATFGGPAGGSIENLHFFSSETNMRLQNVNYAYNSRGWLTNINDITYVPTSGFGQDTGDNYNDLFNFRINYNSTDGTLGATPLYNGNIAQTLWKTKSLNEDIRGYSYNYDDMNRIKQATGFKGRGIGLLAVNPMHEVTGLSYDKNGNISTLIRNGADDLESNNGVWDDLVYQYDGNKLLNVLDQSSSSSTYKDLGFLDGNVETVSNVDDFEYDANGNMKLDRNKDIQSITYNHLNLPELITKSSEGVTGTVQYVYDATGVKQASIYDADISSNNTIFETHYAGNFVYDTELSEIKLQFFKTPEGYVDPVTNTLQSVASFSKETGTTSYSDYNYVYQYKDHLGNVRLSYADKDLDGVASENEIIAEDNYYPFGLKQKGRIQP
jgi:hypothetical protein